MSFEHFLDPGWKKNKSDGLEANEMCMLCCSEKIEVRHYHVPHELNNHHSRCELL